MTRTQRATAEFQSIHGQTLACHKVTPRQSMSWHMARTHDDGSYDSAYAYSVTWTPGTLVISGDLDEFVVTHYHAMKTIQDTVRWLNGISFDYLMGKSSAKKEYNSAETFRDIIDIANDEAIDVFRNSLRGEREFRAAKLDALIEWDRDETLWALECAEGVQSFRPLVQDYLPDPGSYDTWAGMQFTREAIGFLNRTQHWVSPGGLEHWLSLYERFEDEIDDEGLGPNCLLSGWGRRQIKECLRSALDDANESDAAGICVELGIPDYYGAQTYPTHCRLWAAAIQVWVDAVIDEILPVAAEAVPGLTDGVNG